MKKFIFLGLVLVSPVATFAAVSDIFSVAGTFGRFLGFIIPILITLAVVYFIWGVISYLIAGDEEKKKKATGMITGGLIGLFLIIAFWGIIRVVTSAFDVGPEQINRGAIPCIPTMYPNGQPMNNCPNN